MTTHALQGYQSDCLKVLDTFLRLAGEQGAKAFLQSIAIRRRSNSCLTSDLAGRLWVIVTSRITSVGIPRMVSNCPASRTSPAPTTRPLALVESAQRLTHQLRPSAAPKSEPDESTAPRRRRRAGVRGAEVWVKLMDADEPAPTTPAALSFLTMTTKPTFRAAFKPGEGGTNWGAPFT